MLGTNDARLGHWNAEVGCEVMACMRHLLMLAGRRSKLSIACCCKDLLDWSSNLKVRAAGGWFS